MYKKLLMWLLCVLQAWVLLAQNVEKYHGLIDKAELLIVDGNEGAALALYQEAFKENFGHFSKDYYNALLCACKTKADAQCINYATQLVKRGVQISFFSKPQLQYLVTLQDLSTLYKETETRFDKSLQDTIALMIKEDQQYRVDNIAVQDLIYKADEINYARIVRIFEKYEYPTELLIGTSTFQGGRRIATRNDFDVLITHQLKNGHCELMDYLTQALRKGLLNPEVFVTHATYCLDDEHRLGYFNRNQEIYYQMDSLIFTGDPAMEPYVNQTRKQYYLCTIEELKKKVHFAYDKSKEPLYSLHCNYAITYRELNGNDLNKNIEELKEKNPSTILYKTLKSNEPYFW